MAHDSERHAIREERIKFLMQEAQYLNRLARDAFIEAQRLRAERPPHFVPVVTSLDIEVGDA